MGVALLLFTGLSLSADVELGYEVFKRTCSACHRESMTPEEIAKIRETVDKSPFHVGGVRKG